MAGYDNDLLSSVPDSESIKVLKLNLLSIERSDVDALVAKMAQCVRLEQLQLHLHLYDAEFLDRVLQALDQLPGLRQLRVEAYFVSLVSLARAAGLPRLRDSVVELHSESVEKGVGEQLCAFPALEKLDVCGGEDAAALCAALPMLREVVITHQLVGVRGCRAHSRPFGLNVRSTVSK